MSEKFVASNGAVIEPQRGGLSVKADGWDYFQLATGQVIALREFFRALRDTELGRWRWPENPDYVVYTAPAGERVPDARHVTVSNEPTGEAAWLFEVAPGSVSGGSSWARDAARAYFAAHPEPKPWHDAKPGEVWAVTTENVADEVALQVTPHDTFQYNNGNEWGIRDLPVVTARRIFPEVVSDDS